MWGNWRTLALQLPGYRAAHGKGVGRDMRWLSAQSTHASVISTLIVPFFLYFSFEYEWFTMQ